MSRNSSPCHQCHWCQNADEGVTDEELERLWTDYTQLYAKAEKSQNIQDGIATGKAWGRFTRAFEKTEKNTKGGGS